MKFARIGRSCRPAKTKLSSPSRFAQARWAAKGATTRQAKRGMSKKKQQNNNTTKQQKKRKENRRAPGNLPQAVFSPCSRKPRRSSLTPGDRVAPVAAIGLRRRASLRAMRDCERSCAWGRKKKTWRAGTRPAPRAPIKPRLQPRVVCQAKTASGKTIFCLIEKNNFKVKMAGRPLFAGRGAGQPPSPASKAALRRFAASRRRHICLAYSPIIIRMAVRFFA